jgi:branched-chain amino acid transport system substrate-binding protein
VSQSRSAASIAFLVLLLAAVLSACGSSEDDGPAATAAGSGAKAPDGAPLRVALIANQTGKLPSGEENSVPVAQAWAKAVNAKGGVAGRPVEVVVADTKGDPATATAAVRKVTADDGIVAAVLFDAGTESVVAKSITAAGLPVVGGMGYAPDAWGAMPNWLPLTTSIPSIFNMGMTLGDHLGGTRTAMTICAEIAGCGAAAPVVEKASTTLGMAYAGTFKVSAAAPDYTAECLKIVKERVDYVMLGAATANAALRVAGDCKTQGYKGQWGLFGGAIVPKAMRANDPGTKLGLVMNSFPWFADAAPATAYRDMMKGQGVDESAWGDPHATAAYATLQLLRKTLDGQAAQLPERLTRKDVIKAYGSVKDETLDGLLPQPVTFTPDKPNGLIDCYWFGSYEGGTFSEADLAKPVCDPPALKTS